MKNIYLINRKTFIISNGAIKHCKMLRYFLSKRQYEIDILDVNSNNGLVFIDIVFNKNMAEPTICIKYFHKNEEKVEFSSTPQFLNQSFICNIGLNLKQSLSE